MTKPADAQLSARKVARLLRVPVRTVTYWASVGRLPGTYTRNGKWRFLASDIQRLLSDEVPNSPWR
ncbi:MAG TPA: helix-turn-helix domain-containing protein [Mycobacteriales bacterium]|nr:helix-turn-helix domain-containing protein [Mycobacteriales bacterium]